VRWHVSTEQREYPFHIRAETKELGAFSQIFHLSAGKQTRFFLPTLPTIVTLAIEQVMLELGAGRCASTRVLAATELC
jgi:hypothetical protein